jgi:hypothetical protein
MNNQNLKKLSDNDICYIIAIERNYSINFDFLVEAMKEASLRKIENLEENVTLIINDLNSIRESYDIVE